MGSSYSMTTSDIKTASSLKCQLQKIGYVQLVRAVGKYHVPPDRAFFEQYYLVWAAQCVRRAMQEDSGSVLLKTHRATVCKAVSAVSALVWKLYAVRATAGVAHAQAVLPMFVAKLQATLDDSFKKIDVDTLAGIDEAIADYTRPVDFNVTEGPTYEDEIAALNGKITVLAAAAAAAAEAATAAAAAATAAATNAALKEAAATAEKSAKAATDALKYAEARKLRLEEYKKHYDYALKRLCAEYKVRRGNDPNDPDKDLLKARAMQHFGPKALTLHERTHLAELNAYRPGAEKREMLAKHEEELEDAKKAVAAAEKALTDKTKSFEDAEKKIKSTTEAFTKAEKLFNDMSAAEAAMAKAEEAKTTANAAKTTAEGARADAKRKLEEAQAKLQTTRTAARGKSN